MKNIINTLKTIFNVPEKEALVNHCSLTIGYKKAGGKHYPKSDIDRLRFFMCDTNYKEYNHAINNIEESFITKEELQKIEVEVHIEITDTDIKQNIDVYSGQSGEENVYAHKFANIIRVAEESKLYLTQPMQNYATEGDTGYEDDMLEYMAMVHSFKTNPYRKRVTSVI